MSRHPVTPMHEADLRRHLAAQGLAHVAGIAVPPTIGAGRRSAGQPAGRPAGAQARRGAAGRGRRRRTWPAVGRLIWQHAQAQRLLAVGPSSVVQALAAHWHKPAAGPRRRGIAAGARARCWCWPAACRRSRRGRSQARQIVRYRQVALDAASPAPATRPTPGRRRRETSRALLAQRPPRAGLHRPPTASAARRPASIARALAQRRRRPARARAGRPCRCAAWASPAATPPARPCRRSTPGACPTLRRHRRPARPVPPAQRRRRARRPGDHAQGRPDGRGRRVRASGARLSLDLAPGVQQAVALRIL